MLKPHLYFNVIVKHSQLLKLVLAVLDENFLFPVSHIHKESTLGYK